MTDTQVWYRGTAIPVNRIDSITDSAPGPSVYRIAGAVLAAFGGFMLLAVLGSYLAGNYRRGEWGAIVAGLLFGGVAAAAGIWMIVMPQKPLWRIHLRQSFGRSTTVAVDSVDAADAFIDALREAKRGELVIERLRISWFVWW